MVTIDQKLNKDLEIVNEIEKIRTGNNVNWMDLLRIGLKYAPKETKKIIRKINSDDRKIGELFSKLGE